MPNIVELQYDPFIPRLSVLINGNHPSDYSRLIQYADEEIWYWCEVILDIIYEELRDDFVVVFTGRPEDIEIIKCVAINNAHCVGFKSKDFTITDSMQVRLGKLNQLIKRERITSYQKTIIDAGFLLAPSMKDYLEDILELDINNLFCSVRVSTIGIKTYTQDSSESYVFIIANGYEEAKSFVNRVKSSNPIFIVFLGENTEISEIYKYHVFYQTSEREFFNTIFNCFLSGPLTRAFRKCANSISMSNRFKEKLIQISMIEPLINVNYDLPIEVGKSNRISVSLSPPIGKTPKLVFKVRNDKIASCDGMAIYGRNAGITVLEIYKSGEKLPFAKKEIEVIKRNRITNILLSDDNLLLGEGDRTSIKSDYAPVDADNTNEIKWKSTDDSVVSVDSMGRLFAKSTGECRIICTAENVSAQCICQVKPYLKEIIIETPLEENVLHMLPLQEETLLLKTIPDNSIDGQITVDTSDYNVVNVVGHKLMAKNKGDAIITLYNRNKRLTKSFTVIVGKPKKQKFFHKLFGQRDGNEKYDKPPRR